MPRPALLRRVVALARALALSLVALALPLAAPTAAQLVPSDAAPAPPEVGRPAGPVEGPFLVVEPSVLELGEVYWGKSVSATLRLTNVGNAALDIGITSTCGCTTAPLAPGDGRIAPGATLELPVTMTPKGPRPSDLVKSLEITTNEPSRPLVQVPVACTVLVGVSAEPAFVLFRDLDLGDTESMTMLLESGDGTPFAIQDVRFTSDLYAAEYSAGVEGVIHEVTVTTGPITARVNPSSKIVVTTTHPRAPQLSLNCNSMVAPVVSTSAQSLFFGVVEPGASSERPMKLWQRKSETPLERVSVTVVKHPDLAIEARRDEQDPLLWHFTLHVPAERAGQILSTAIRIENELGADAALVMMAGARVEAAR